MKKILIVLLALSILAFAGVVIAGVSDPGISGTPHDIPTFIGGGKAGTEPCAYCHTPHVPTGVTLVYPLWNRSQSGITYTMYSSATFDMWDADLKGQAVVDASTRACMQCHNGQTSGLVNYPGRGLNADNTAYDLLQGDAATNFPNLGNLGTDLSNEHPVAFTYVPLDASDQQDNGFPVITNNKVNDLLPLYSQGAAPGEMMGCGSCHEPHDRFIYGGKKADLTGTQVFFLRNGSGNVGNAGSDLCKFCHTNKYGI